jgi:signal transduction histidine kinase
MPRISLAKKATLWIGLPFLIQALLSGILLLQIDDIQHLEDQEYRSKNLIGQANWVLVLCLSGNLSSLAQKLSNNQADLVVIKKDPRADLPREFKELSSLFEPQDKRLAPMQQMQRAADQIFQYLNEFKLNADKTNLIGELHKMNQLWQQLQDARHDLLRLDRESYGTNTDQSHRARERLHDVVVFVTSVYFIFAIALAYVFSQNIAKRLRVLTDNTLLFATGKPLHKLVSGDDELSDYDQTFHNMAAQIAESAKKEQEARHEVERLKREFLAMVSHDLRSPLTTVGGTIGLIKSGNFGEINDRGIRLLNTSATEINRLTRLVQDLLDVAKIESGKFDLNIKPFPLEDIIEKSKTSTKYLADKKEISIVSEPTALQVLVDGDRLVQVLINLLTNAIKFSPDDTSIEISSRLIDQSIEVSVRDYGRGIPESHITAVFDRFQQVERADATEKGGTGLGLAICKSIIEQHGGTIGVNSIVGQGTTFWFRVPTYQPDPPLSADSI